MILDLIHAHFANDNSYPHFYFKAILEPTIKSFILKKILY